MTPNAADISFLFPHATHFTEFGVDPVTGQKWTGICTQVAAKVIMGIASGEDATLDGAMELARKMVAAKQCAENGASTIPGITSAIEAEGYTVLTSWDYQALADPRNDVHKKLLAVVHSDNVTERRPALLQVQNGQALKDIETGAHDEAGLHGHALGVVGYQPKGWICVDPDNPDVSKRFQIYPWATLEAAQPSGIVVIDLKIAIKPPLPTGAVLAGANVQWNGCTIADGFLAWCETNNWKFGKPLTNSFTSGDHTYQTFDYGELRYTKAEGVFEANLGADLVRYRAILAKIRGELS